MKNQSLISVINAVSFNADTLYPLVEVYGLERGVEVHTKIELYYAILDSDDEFIKSKDAVKLSAQLWNLHKPVYLAKAVVAFKKDYK
jgi:hypothetical protein